MNTLPENAAVLICHAGIAYERRFGRAYRNEASEWYKKGILYAEHVASYATRPFLWSLFVDLSARDFQSAGIMFLCSQAYGFIGDGYLAYKKEGQPQVDQLACNLVGGMLFLLYSNIVSSLT